MNRERLQMIDCALLAVIVAIGGALAIGDVVAADKVTTSGGFELGDGGDPLLPGAADITGSLLQEGPDWDDLFNADRSLKDEMDEFGNVGSNGVPDFLDTWGRIRTRRDIAFVADPIGDGGSPGGELGNAYAYTMVNRDRHLVVYAGVERLPSTTSDIFLEWNRALFSIGSGGAIVGDRTPGDLRVGLLFNSGVLSSVQIRRYEEDGTWVDVETLPVSPEQPTEQCNAAGTACVVSNGASIVVGSWPSYDDAGNAVTELAANAFVELGIDVGALFGVDTFGSYYESRYTSLQISTTEDSALGTFVRAAKLAQ